MVLVIPWRLALGLMSDVITQSHFFRCEEIFDNFWFFYSLNVWIRHELNG